MYVNNVRNAINSLNEEEFEEFLSRLRFVLQNKFRKKVKPSELRLRINEFIKGKNPKIDYFEAYLLTFDDIYLNGAEEALKKGKNKPPKSWRDILLKVTGDRPVPYPLNKYLEDEQIALEVKALFHNFLMYSSDDDKDLMFKNLYEINRFIEIGIKKKNE